ncbi:hypothetical protein WJX73_006755 [Symbiochloris irregularis]|uniref:Protein kinase domain-containing protein n=1 Tax=Symbiochloris irregularis TaxID=706552 RepID=A0AAW1PSU3_9CHLO
MTEPGDDFLAGHPRYQQLHYLSRGLFGYVVLAMDKTTGQLVAVKFIERTLDKLTRNVEREIINHSSLSHPHIVHFNECFLTVRHLAIVMEYCAGGNMWQYVADNRGLDEDRARWFYQQLILALDYIHKMSVSNRDIKLENTLLDTSQPNTKPLLKVCDFGYSINESLSLPRTAVGTPGYVAPEVLTNRRRYDGKLTDVWSSGVMLYAMLFCQYPFERPGDEQDKKRNQLVMQRTVNVQYEFPAHKPISDECRDLLARIFVADPGQRITVREIHHHPWFRHGMPPDLDVDRYNEHWTTPTQSAERAASVRSILRDALRTSPSSAIEAPSAQQQPQQLHIVTGR